MATHTIEAMLSPSAAVTGWEQNVGNKGIDQVSAITPTTNIHPGRRCEARMEYRCMYSYGMLEGIEKESALIEQGVAFTLNRSTEGMLLLMGQSPGAKQVIEVRTPRSRWSRTVSAPRVATARFRDEPS
ncbi:MAG: hypothetical protein L0Z46_01620 [Nitrospiraceae bacterium]|nr:hypothetical protein [Nitrospiraceae bacterium]